jgi:hypothetical protein
MCNVRKLTSRAWCGIAWAHQRSLRLTYTAMSLSLQELNSKRTSDESHRYRLLGLLGRGLIDVRINQWHCHGQRIVI